MFKREAVTYKKFCLYLITTSVVKNFFRCDRFVESRSHLFRDTAVRGGSGGLQFSEKSEEIKNFDGKPKLTGNQSVLQQTTQ